MEKYLTVDQLGDILQISTKTIYQWTHTGFIPHLKLPKGVRFRISDVERWLKNKERKGRNKYKVAIDNF